VTDTLLDRLIAYLSPIRGAQRSAARRAIEALSYEGARRGRREQGWVTGGTSANAEISGDRLTLRDRARSLLRDNAYASKGVAVLVTNRVGTGILASADGQNRRVNERLSARLERWIDRCDYTGRTDLYGIQALAERARVESGECFIRFVRLEEGGDDDDIPLRLEVLEPDYLDTTKNEKLENGREIREGIEYARGRPVAYWLFTNHPGENSPIFPFSRQSIRVPVSEVLHYYRVQRPGQLTGVTELAPVIRRLWDLDGYADAELMRKKIAACSVGFITSPAGLPGAALGPTTLGQDGRRTETIAPGVYHYGKPGESITFFDPKPSEGYSEFFGVELHAIASGLGMPYELLTGDLSEVTYTSHRGGLVQFRASVEADQWQLIIPQLVRPIWDEFVAYAEMTPGLHVPAKFTPPRFGLLDPAKEIPAMIQAVQGGLRSWRDTIRREGDDPAKVLDEIEAEREEFADRGISVTSIAPTPSAAPTPEDAAA
jgi:lambda family phage portal protein